MATEWATVMMGDVVDSRADAPDAAEYLDNLRRRWNEEVDGRMADFSFTQGDELQGLLAPTEDPFRLILDAGLTPRSGPSAYPRLRWSVVHGLVDIGLGSATRRTGSAFVRARSALQGARDTGDLLSVVTGSVTWDTLLQSIAPVWLDLIEAMTDRQRFISRLSMLDGYRQSEIADLIGVSRPTVSVALQRAGTRDVERLLLALRVCWEHGQAEGGTAPETDEPDRE
jgi:DNA-binding CsgD family transcriptional regulator